MLLQLVSLKNQNSNRGQFISSIQKGLVYVYDSEKNFTIRKDENLTLDVKKINKLNIVIENNKISTYIEGTFKSAKINSSINTKDLSPSLFQYLYVNKPLKSLWSSIVFIWGIIWGIKGFFRI